MVDRVVRSVLLEVLEPAVRDALVSHLRPRRYRRGQVVFNDGELGDCLHVIQSGRLDVSVATASGRTITLRIVQPGEIVGEMALVRPEHRRLGRAVALEAAETLALHQRDFETLRALHPSVDRFLVAVLSDRVARTSQLVVDLLQPPDVRVWRRLAVLAEAYGPDSIKMSQDDLAHAAGTVRQTVNRVLRIAAHDGVVEVGRGSIRVLDRAALERHGSGAPTLS